MGDSLFSWSATSSDFCVIQVCNCGPRQVFGCLTNGRTHQLVAVDPHTSKQTAQYDLSASSIVNVGCLANTNQLFVVDDEGQFCVMDLRVFSDPQLIIATKEKKPIDTCGAGAVDSSGHVVAIGTSYDSEPNKKRKKKTAKKEEGESSESDTDSESCVHSVDIWDLRNTSSIVQVYSESHSDSVQALSFSAEAPELLISGDADGLINIFDVRHKDEDDAIQSSNQLESSINRVGFLCSSRAYAVLDDNRCTTFRLNSPDDIDVLFKKSAADDTFLVDILDEGGESVCALFSSAAGVATLQSFTNNGQENGEPQNFHCHEDLIRCATYSVKDRLLVTGGEDGKICGRELLPQASSPGITTKKKPRSSRKKPYAK